MNAPKYHVGDKLRHIKKSHIFFIITGIVQADIWIKRSWIYSCINNTGFQEEFMDEKFLDENFILDDIYLKLHKLHKVL